MSSQNPLLNVSIVAFPTRLQNIDPRQDYEKQ